MGRHNETQEGRFFRVTAEQTVSGETTTAATTDYTYDEKGQITKITKTFLSSTVEIFYEYDERGNIIYYKEGGVDSPGYSPEPGYHSRYEYDDKNQLIREDYFLSNTKYEFETIYAGQDISLYDININDSKSIENTIKRGNVNGIKVGKDNEGLGGALIGIFASNTTEFTKKTAIATVTSADNGSFSFEGVPYGEWIIKEISAPKGYVLDDTEHHIYITDDGVTLNIKIVNNKIFGKIKVYKTDGKTKTPLEGVVFEVFDKDGKVVSTITTDKDGIAITEDLEYGDYTVKEKTAKEGYVLDETVHEIQIREHEKVYELELTNNKIPEQPNVPQTGDYSNLGFWIGLGAIALGGLVSLIIVKIKKKKDDE